MDLLFEASLDHLLATAPSHITPQKGKNLGEEVFSKGGIGYVLNGIKTAKSVK